MKHTALWITFGAVLIVALIVASKYYKPAPELPPADAMLVEPETTVSPAYGLTVPLSKNKTTTKSGMTIDIIKESTTGEKISNGNVAVVSYVGMLEDGTVFDASKNHGDGSFSFPLGGGRVIKGWDEGVLGMRVGETRKLTIPAELGYGAQGVPGVIPPNATLIFEVTLLAIK